MFKSVPINWRCTSQDSANKAWFDDCFWVITNLIASCSTGKVKVVIIVRNVAGVDVVQGTISGMHVDIMDLHGRSVRWMHVKIVDSGRWVLTEGRCRAGMGYEVV